MKCQIQPIAAIIKAGTMITDMAIKYERNACTPLRKLPVPPHTARGMIINMAAMTAIVFKKVSIPA